MRKTLLDQIESEAMDGDVVKALRLCIKLGGHSGSADLRQWAERELNGYDSEDELPDYRRINAPLCYDGTLIGVEGKGSRTPNQRSSRFRPRSG